MEAGMKKNFLNSFPCSLKITTCLFFQASQSLCMEEDWRREKDPIEILTQAAFESFTGKESAQAGPEEPYKNKLLDRPGIREQFKQLQAELCTIKKKSEKGKQHIALLANKNKQLQQEMIQAEVAHNILIGEKNHKNEELKSKINRLKEEVEKEKQRNIILINEKKQLGQEKTKTEMDYNTLRAEKEQKTEAFQSKLNTLEEKIEKGKQCIILLKNENKQLEKEKEQEKVNYRKLLDEKEQKSKDMQIQIMELKEERVIEKNHIAVEHNKFKKENEQARVEINKLKEELKQYARYQKYKVEVCNDSFYFTKEQVSKHPWLLTPEQRLVLGNSCAKESPAWINFELLKR
jgi:hypothetical protein